MCCTLIEYWQCHEEEWTIITSGEDSVQSPEDARYWNRSAIIDISELKDIKVDFLDGMPIIDRTLQLNLDKDKELDALKDKLNTYRLMRIQIRQLDGRIRWEI